MKQLAIATVVALGVGTTLAFAQEAGLTGAESRLHLPVLAAFSDEACVVKPEQMARLARAEEGLRLGERLSSSTNERVTLAVQPITASGGGSRFGGPLVWALVVTAATTLSLFVLGRGHAPEHSIDPPTRKRSPLASRPLRSAHRRCRCSLSVGSQPTVAQAFRPARARLKPCPHTTHARRRRTALRLRPRDLPSPPRVATHASPETRPRRVPVHGPEQRLANEAQADARHAGPHRPLFGRPSSSGSKCVMRFDATLKAVWPGRPCCMG